MVAGIFWAAEKVAAVEEKAHHPKSCLCRSASLCWLGMVVGASVYSQWEERRSSKMEEGILDRESPGKANRSRP